MNSHSFLFRPISVALLFLALFAQNNWRGQNLSLDLPWAAFPLDHAHSIAAHVKFHFAFQFSVNSTCLKLGCFLVSRQPITKSHPTTPFAYKTPYPITMASLGSLSYPTALSIGPPIPSEDFVLYPFNSYQLAVCPHLCSSNQILMVFSRFSTASWTATPSGNSRSLSRSATTSNSTASARWESST